MTLSGFEISTFLDVEAVVTLNYASFSILERASSGNRMKLFSLVNQFTISRLFTFLRKYQKMKVLKRTITAKINNIKKQRYNLLIFQKTEKKKNFQHT